MVVLERLTLLAVHLLLIATAVAGAWVLRFDPAGLQRNANSVANIIIIAVLVKGAVFYLFGLYRNWWWEVGLADVVRLFIANLTASAALVSVALLAQVRIPVAVYILECLVCFLLLCLLRGWIRIYREITAGKPRVKARKNILIYGAGGAGQQLLKETRKNASLGYCVIGFIDDDRRKLHATVSGVRILGIGRDIVRIVDHYRDSRRRIEEVVIAMPSASGREMREAVAHCRAANVSCKTVPGFNELLSRGTLNFQVRPVNVCDLLGREPVNLDEETIRRSIQERPVLVTGAAGSIGSELCRQLARFGPKVLVMFDQAESELFRIEMELRRSFPRLECIPVVGDIVHSASISETIFKYSIKSVFHAAAYKHVPMMEANVLEAIQNNVLGTWNVVQASRRHDVRTLLMISTDKAVNATSVMGTTKRAAELIVSAVGTNARDGNYLSVRFGNVLASNGSVVTVFRQQIADGGPVTVTHPEMKRYFMTIPEAVQLVLQASTMGKGSEVFVLNMGQPVRIADLARNMIRLAGFEPGEDIEIRYTGVRPGEKLFEELNLGDEHLQSTYHEKILIFKGTHPNEDVVTAWVGKLRQLIDTRNEEAALAHLRELVPEYRPARLSAQNEVAYAPKTFAASA